jgi:hypothetical protein
LLTTLSPHARPERVLRISKYDRFFLFASLVERTKLCTGANAPDMNGTVATAAKRGKSHHRRRHLRPDTQEFEPHGDDVTRDNPAGPRACAS